VQGKYDSQSKTLRVVSRSISEMRLNIPPQWTPLELSWDGLVLDRIEKPGCYLLSIDKELLNARRCTD
jgi:hypothetical protein